MRKNKEPRLGDFQEWGQDEIRIYTMRGWCIVEKKLYEEVINSFPPLPPSYLSAPHTPPSLSLSR